MLPCVSQQEGAVLSRSVKAVSLAHVVLTRLVSTAPLAPLTEC